MCFRALLPASNATEVFCMASFRDMAAKKKKRKRKKKGKRKSKQETVEERELLQIQHLKILFFEKKRQMLGRRSFSTIPLSSIVHVDKLRTESPKSIKKAWLRHHQKRDSIASVLEAASFARLRERTAAAPLFVFPVPAPGGGFRSLFFQSSGDVHLYTELEEYRRNGSAARPALSCVFHGELAEEKGLVLMRGQVNTAVLSPTDAAFLANQTTIWFFDEERWEHVKKFNHAPNEFNFDKVLEMMQRL